MSGLVRACRPPHCDATRPADVAVLLRPVESLHGIQIDVIGDRLAFGIAAQAMRRILVDHARAHTAGKRGDGAQKVPLDAAMAIGGSMDIGLLALDEALTRLAAIDPQQSRVVELRFFGGLTMEETAEVMHISPATVGREWRMAKAWLFAEISRTA